MLCVHEKINDTRMVDDVGNTKVIPFANKDVTKAKRLLFSATRALSVVGLTLRLIFVVFSVLFGRYT
jgi:hypothetical protein